MKSGKIVAFARFGAKPKICQTLVEYGMLLCVLVAAILIMQGYIKRAYQGRLKQESDSLGPQFSLNNTTTYSRQNVTMVSETYTGGSIPAGGLAGLTAAAQVDDGMSVTVSRTNTSTVRMEKTDSMVLE